MAKGKYHGVDMEALANQSLGGGGQFQKRTWWKAKDTNTPYEIRVLPPIGDMGGLPWFEAHLFFNGFANSGWEVPGRDGKMTKRAIYSLNFHGDVPEDNDPMELLMEWLLENGEDETYRKLKASVSFYMNVVYEGQVMPWGAPTTAARAIQTIMKGKIGDITDPVRGRPIEVTRFNSQPWYTVTHLDREALDLEDWEKDATDFSQLVSLFTVSDIYAILWHNLRDRLPLKTIFPKIDFEGLWKKFYQGGGSTEEAQEAPPSKPKPKAKATKKAAKATTKKKSKK